MYTTRRLLLVTVAVLVAATLAGLVVLWPGTPQLGEEAPPQDLVEARVRSVETVEGEPDPVMGLSGRAVRIEAQLLEGPDAGETTTIEAPVEGYPSFRPGDQVKLTRSGVPGEEGYFVADFVRTTPLLLLGALFVAAVLAAGRWHGLRSLVGLALSLVIVTRFIIPGILTGRSPFAVALVGGIAVMVLTLYLAHGVNEMTTTAVVATSVALGLTVLLGSTFIDLGKITGYSSEEANLARFAVEGLDLQGLVLAGMIIATLGVLDDVTVTQASTVFALHRANPQQSWAQLVGGAMRVGRDHIASTVNTLFLAYAGASLALLVLFSTGGVPTSEIVNSEIVAQEIIKMAVGSIGLIAAVPLTTALAASLARRGAAGPTATAHAGHGVPAVVGEPQPESPQGRDRRTARHAGRPRSPRSSRRAGGIERGEDAEEEAYRAWLRFMRGDHDTPPRDTPRDEPPRGA